MFLNTAGAANVEGTIVSSPYLSNDVSAASKKFAAAYKAAYGEGAGTARRQGVRRRADHADRAEDQQRRAPARRSPTPSAPTTYQGLLGNFAYDSTGVGIFATSIGIITEREVVKPPAEPGGRRPAILAGDNEGHAGLSSRRSSAG